MSHDDCAVALSSIRAREKKESRSQVKGSYKKRGRKEETRDEEQKEREARKCTWDWRKSKLKIYCHPMTRIKSSRMHEYHSIAKGKEGFRKRKMKKTAVEEKEGSGYKSSFSSFTVHVKGMFRLITEQMLLRKKQSFLFFLQRHNKYIKR